MFPRNVGKLLRLHSVTCTSHHHYADLVQFVSVSTVEAAGTSEYINCFLDDVNMSSVMSFIMLDAVFGRSAMCHYSLTVSSLGLYF
jgi:hypothetical protein